MTEVCGGKTRAGGNCTRPAGWGTQHVGTGRCKLHAGNAGRPITHGLRSRYAPVTRPRIKALLEAFDADETPLDLLPEVKLLRALILDYVERYDENTDALIAWHSSFNPAYDPAFALWQAARDKWQVMYAEWQEAFAEYKASVEEVQAYYRGGWPEPPTVPPFPDPPPPPVPSDFAGKPHNVIDILSAGKFIAQVGALVERIEKQKSEGSITLLQLKETLNRFGFEMYQGLNETVDNDTLRTAILENVEHRWSAVTLPESNRRA